MKKHVGVVIFIGLFTVVSFFTSTYDLLPKSEQLLQKRSQQKSIASTNDKQSSRKIAEKFIQQYSPYDEKKPLSYYERIKPYVTENFLRRYAKELLPKGIKGRSLIKVQTYAVDQSKNTSIVWNVIAFEEIILPNQHITNIETWYWVTVKKNSGGEWKVIKAQVTSNG